LLGILGEPSRNERARSLLTNLVTVLGDITSNIDPAELSGPIARSISALQRLISIQDARPIVPKADDPGSGSQSSPSTTYPTIEDLNAAFNFEDPALTSQSPLAGLDMESSPYALMDSIIWGAKKSP
jgi:hypothetical protein